MTAKQQVLSEIPNAKIVLIFSEQKFVVLNGNNILGKGELRRFAWADALKNIQKNKTNG